MSEEIKQAEIVSQANTALVNTFSVRNNFEAVDGDRAIAEAKVYRAANLLDELTEVHTNPEMSDVEKLETLLHKTEAAVAIAGAAIEHANKDNPMQIRKLTVKTIEGLQSAQNKAEYTNKAQAAKIVDTRAGMKLAGALYNAVSEMNVVTSIEYQAGEVKQLESDVTAQEANALVISGGRSMVKPLTTDLEVEVRVDSEGRKYVLKQNTVYELVTCASLGQTAKTEATGLEGKVTAIVTQNLSEKGKTPEERAIYVNSGKALSAADLAGQAIKAADYVHDAAKGAGFENTRQTVTRVAEKATGLNLENKQDVNAFFKNTYRVDLKTLEDDVIKFGEVEEIAGEGVVGVRVSDKKPEEFYMLSKA